MNNIQWDAFAKSVADYTGMEQEEMKKATDLYSDLGMDSLGLFSLGIHLTETFQLEVPLSSVAVIQTVGDMYDLLLNEGVTPCQS